MNQTPKTVELCGRPDCNEPAAVSVEALVINGGLIKRLAFCPECFGRACRMLGDALRNYAVPIRPE